MSLQFNSTLAFDNFNRGYAIAMFAMWGVGVDIPRLLVRYGKAYPFTINIHSMSMLMIGLLTLMYVIAEISLYLTEYGSGYQGLGRTQMVQFIMSIILACFIIIQFILGFLVRVQMFKDSAKTSLFRLKRIHKIGGYIIVILGKVIATLIVEIHTQQTVFKAWLFILAAIILVYIILQILYRSGTRSLIFQCFFKQKNKHEKYHNEIYKKLIDKSEKINNFKQKGVRYVIIDNSMYYIDEHFMHPGGQYIFSILNGKQINYYLKGAKEISPDYPRHSHNKYVAKYLENRLIGQLQTQSLLENQKYPSETVDWSITQAIKTNYQSAYLISFRNQSGMIRNQFRVENFGKYIMMGCMTEEVLSKCQRPYYLCLFCSEYQRAILDRLRNYYKQYYFDEKINENDGNNKLEVATRTLTFFIKTHKQGLFTRFLLNAPKQRIFSICGPYGKGLELKQKSKGYYMIIAAGIGIVPFADLFAYLLQKTLYQLISRKASQSRLAQINTDDTSWDGLSDLRIMLVGSFTNSQKFYLSTPIKQLYYINMKHGLKNFNMLLHYQNNEVQHEIKMVKEKFNKQFFIGLMEEQQPDRVFYSGPTNLEHILRKAEPELKLKQPICFL